MMNTFQTFNQAHFVLYPTNKLMAILDTSDQMQAAITQLNAIGLPEREMEVLAGCEELNTSFGVDSTHQSALSRVWRRIEKVAHIEQREHREYAQAAEKGLGVFAVHVPNADQRAEAIAILKANGGHYLHFYTPKSIEPIAP